VRLNWGTAPVSVLAVVEILLTLLCIAVAFARPGFASNWFSRIEQLVRAVSRRPWLCALILFSFPIFLRLLLLPVYGPPAPFISDEYAYLLQSDTFASGRLTNPAPALWQNFASIYVLARPTYTAEYQAGQGLVLALGQVLTGVPWAGVILSMGAMCAVTYWALLPWLPSIWAFSGTLVLVDIELGVLSYWMNSFWGGCLPAIGGALAVGGLLRLRDRKRVLFSFVMASGLVVLMNTRPLEGVFMTIVAAGALVFWTFSSKHLRVHDFLTRVLPSLALSVVAVLAFTGYYNYRVTGSATEFPYLLYRSEYGLPQGFFWQKPVPAGTDLPPDIRSEYEDQLRQHERRNSLAALLGATGGKVRRFWEFYIGIPMTVTLIFVPFIWRERNMRLALWTLVMVLGVENLTFFAYFPHYSAAVTVLIVLVVLQSIRRMRVSGSTGLFLSRALPLVCVFGLVIPMCGRWIEGSLPRSLAGARRLWDSEFMHEVSRERFLPELQRQPGKQLVLVRYQPYNGERKTEWIFNRANLLDAQIVWARESDDSRTVQRLIEQFAGRKVWLAEPDAKPPRIVPYPGTSQH
jgi:hypothetical protein